MDVVRISDGLGNQMFQYAFAKKIQLLTGKKVYLDTRYINNEDVCMQNGRDRFHEKCDAREYGLNHFKITLPVADNKDLFRWRFMSQRNILEQVFFDFSEKYLWPWQYRNEDLKKITFKKRDQIYSIYYYGYFFDLRYYDDIRNILRKEFQLKEPVRLPSELYRVLKNDITVGIHIRRGDFTRLSRDISQNEYYPRAVKKMEEYVKDPVYLVFSDDIEWVKENMEINARKIYVSEMGFSDFQELAIMKHCKHNIIANSTFSYWAAYLNNNPQKIVICPRRWKKDIIPKEWISI